MKFVKYQGLISKIQSHNEYSSEIITQQSQTFTHLKFFVTSKDLEQVIEKVEILSFEDYVENLSKNGFFQDITKVDIKTIMELVLEQASDDLVWIENLNEVEYKEILQHSLKEALN